MLEPRAHTLAMLSLGGSVGTPSAGITGEVVVVRDEAELDALGEGAKDRLVLFNNPMPPYDPEKGSGYGTAVRFRGSGARLAAAKGAVACLIRSVTATSLRSPHTGAMRYGDAPSKIPAAAISIEDAEMIARLTARGQRVVVRLNMEARDEGMAPSANVVAELRGRTNPDEIVVIGGHIDSWDVGQGAHDDGAGCVIAMEALNVLRRLNLTPRRTIRVVLWTNEENGLAGAKQYAQDHADELSKHVAAVEADSGAFRPAGFSVDFEDESRRQLAVKQMEEIIELLGTIGPLRARAGGGGADIGPLRPAGVPLLGFEVEGSKYFDYHHSHADTLDKVDRHELSQCVAAMAVTAYVLADMPGRLGEPSP
jgi:carboxypeptidase Q